MVTGANPDIEFEHEGSKIQTVTDRCVALSAGDVFAGTELFRRVHRRLQDTDNPPIADVAEIVKDEFAAERRIRAEEEILQPRGVTFQEFYEKWVREWPDPLAAGIDSEIQQLQYPLIVLLAGVDDEPHIYRVRDPGVVDCHDDMGFCAIGSGASLALLQCIASKAGPESGIARMLYQAYEAKVNAEAAPGVGEETNMALITPAELRHLSAEEVQKLGDVFAMHQRRPAPDEDAIATILSREEEAPDNGSPGRADSA
jgi:ATP-dependent protease HslVU (ClpYQ) peptidase subunit